MTSRYTAVPAEAPHGASYQVWVIRDRSTNLLVKALPPAPDPLRFYSYAHAQAWIRKNEPRSTFEIRLIDSTSPHFLQLECWGLWDLDNQEYLRVPGSSNRIRRFYTRAGAEAFERHLRQSAP
ncbi:hypothetical protein ABZW30_25140 [Kitasatospora sp. NPDC004669]|uniref:hypothetical protein n=1 Tax=Kitasatospora sp. NPDC004669 TaxID=3154555 RepID=UPI0033A3AA71